MNASDDERRAKRYRANELRGQLAVIDRQIGSQQKRLNLSIQKLWDLHISEVAALHKQRQLLIDELAMLEGSHSLLLTVKRTIVRRFRKLYRLRSYVAIKLPGPRQEVAVHEGGLERLHASMAERIEEG